MTEAPALKPYVSERSAKRRRTDSPDSIPLDHYRDSAGQLSLLDVWGNGTLIQEDQPWKIGVKYKKQLSFRYRQNKNHFNYHRNNDNNNKDNGTFVNHHLQHDRPLICSKTEEVYSSSIASRTNSNFSLFSLHHSSPPSDITDGFDDLDFEFDPKLFVLEVDPHYGLHPTWLDQLKPVLMQPEILSLHQQLGPSHLGYDYKAGQQPVSLLTQVFPHPQDLYNWSRLTPLDQVKVVILGSKPSQCPGYSHGLAFSQPVACPRLSGAIESIHRELSIEYPHQFIKPNHGSLVSWTKSGVLLLNEIQTTQRDYSLNNSKLDWFEFTARILEIVSQFGGSSNYNTDQMIESHHPSSPPTRKGVVFIAWGEQALHLIRSAGIHLSDRNHLILTCKGTPYANSAHEDGFFHNQHFISSNEFLSSTYGHEYQIDWCKLEPIDPLS